MGQGEAALRAKLLAGFEVILDKALAEAGEAGRLTLSHIETVALHAGTHVEQTLSQALADATAGQSIPGPACPKCQAEMRYKGQKERRVRTRSGEVSLRRAYYYCPDCRRGFFPPG